MELSELPVAAVAQAMTEPDNWHGGMMAAAILLAFLLGLLIGGPNNTEL